LCPRPRPPPVTGKKLCPYPSPTGTLNLRVRPCPPSNKRWWRRHCFALGLGSSDDNRRMGWGAAEHRWLLAWSFPTPSLLAQADRD
jgi:hypothetical protein